MARTTTFTSWARTACGLLAGALARLALGCGASDEDARQGVAPTPSPAHFTIDFEAFPLGAPVRPLAVSAHGPSAARVIATPDHGRVLEVQGDPTPGAFAVTRYDGAAVSGDVSLRFEVNPAAVGLHGAKSVGAELVAQDPFGPGGGGGEQLHRTVSPRAAHAS